jgi:diguanylate cyclase (GGDEF)-like protein
MTKTDIRDKNARIVKLVVVLIWLVVFLIVILGIVFPLVYISSLKDVYLKDQSVTLNTSSEFVREYILEREKILSIASDMSFMKDKTFFAKVHPELKGIPDDEIGIQREFFQRILDNEPSFRFFAYLTPDKVQPIFLQPYQFQLNLTQEQFDRGYAYREWAQNTKKKYHDWDKKSLLVPYVSSAFVSQPGNVPAISLSTAVLDDEKKMVGILYVNMGLETLSHYIKSLEYGKTGKVYLVDSAGHLVAHPSISPGVEEQDEHGKPIWVLRNISSNPMVERALKGDFTAGLFRLPDSNKVVLSSFRVIPDVGWTIIIEQDVAEAFSIVRIYVYVIVLLALMTIVIAVTTFIYISRETAEATKQHQELMIISETDPLTGLLNRRSMLSRMTQIVAEAEQSSSGFVLAMFDIDDFKNVNDSYGHIFGDIVLREIAARTVSILRVEDLLFRWGGEEFLVIIRNCDLVRGRAVAEKIRKVVAGAPINDGTFSQTVTVTIGVCRYKQNSIDSMIVEADEALYTGKRTGKNKVVVAKD